MRAVILSSVLALSLFTACQVPSQRPNILFAISDDQSFPITVLPDASLFILLHLTGWQKRVFILTTVLPDRPAAHHQEVLLLLVVITGKMNNRVNMLLRG